MDHKFIIPVYISKEDAKVDENLSARPSKAKQNISWT